MEKLLDYLSSLPDKYRQGKKYEELLKAYQLTDEQVKKNGSSPRTFSPRDREEVKNVPRSSSYRQSSLEILYGLFERQTQKYLQELYGKYGNFTDTYNDLQKNRHPSGGKRKKDEEPKTVNDQALMRELDRLGIRYLEKKVPVSKKPQPRMRQTKKDSSDSDSESEGEDHVQKLREEFEKQRKQAEENIRKAKDAEEQKKKEDEERKKKQEEERRHRQQEPPKTSGEEDAFFKYTPKLNDKLDAMRFFGVSATYSIDDISRIRRRKALELHPDKQNGRTDLFVKMEEYFELLKFCREKGY